MHWLQVIILSIVEGITEFLPISSTGHMIIASSIMGISDDAFTKLFEVCIQLGAILSVVVLYWRKFLDFSRIQFYIKLVVAFIPAAIAGLLFAKKIDALLESPFTVGMSMLLGGILLLFIDSLFKNLTVDKDENISFGKAFIIGCFQVVAMIPGVSRSAATIVGGMQQKLTRRLAAEFSFFLAVPTMFAATVKKLYDFHKEGFTFQPGQMSMLIVGNIIAFIVAMIAIRSFIQFLQKHSFRAFGVYRIIAAAVIFVLLYANVIKKGSDAPAKAQAKTTFVKAAGNTAGA
ncbi:MAG: undecaprenyl-diphosphate phosphatase [Bacteroidetes bacterium]|nr:undecaprenyl-diphosphate phosphatase [Bacteroidota bacterium]